MRAMMHLLQRHPIQVQGACHDWRTNPVVPDASDGVPRRLETACRNCYHANIRSFSTRTAGDANMAEHKTILIVDDDLELSDGLRAVLERQGYRVIQARDGHQGKLQVYNQRPDLVILDMMMPRMGG